MPASQHRVSFGIASETTSPCSDRPLFALSSFLHLAQGNSGNRKVTALIIAQQFFLGWSLTARFLFFFRFTGEAPPGEVPIPSTGSETRALGRTGKLHSAVWERFGVVGLVSKWVLLLAVINVGVLVSLRRSSLSSTHLASSSLGDSVADIKLLSLSCIEHHMESRIPLQHRQVQVRPSPPSSSLPSQFLPSTFHLLSTEAYARLSSASPLRCRSIYYADQIAQVIVSTGFLVKIVLNIFESSRTGRSKWVMAGLYSAPLAALVTGTAVSAGGVALREFESRRVPPLLLPPSADSLLSFITVLFSE